MVKDIFRLQIDVGLTMNEFGMSLMSQQLLDSMVPKGNGEQPVLTLPGFTATESSMTILNRFLNRNGYIAQGWGLGNNQGPVGERYEVHVEKLTAALRDKVSSLADRYGQRVALVGQSLGGVDAREIALRLEDSIDRVITLGAPTFVPHDMRPHNKVLRSMGKRQGGLSLEDQFGPHGAVHWPAHLPAIPCIAIHSPIDAAVDERSTKIPKNVVRQSQSPAIRENLRIICSHGGMALNPFVLLAIADRLAADIDNWQPFDYQHYSNFLTDPMMKAIYAKNAKAPSSSASKRFASTLYTEQ